MKKLFFFLLAFSLCWNVFYAGAQENTVPALNSEVINSDPDISSPGDTGTKIPPVSLESTIFHLQYGRPQSIADQVREIMGSAPGVVIVNEQARQLEVSAPPELLEKIKALILNLDQQRDIAVDVRVVQVDLNDEHPLGINWSAIVSDYKSFSANEDKRKLSVGTVSTEDLAVLLEALETVGETTQFPLKTVKFSNGQDTDLRLKAFDRDVAVTMTPLAPAPSHDIEQQDRYTVRLVLSPVASGEDTVDFHILTNEGGGILVHIKNNAVAVIGGIFTQAKSESTKKFPFLGDLPLFGVVFRDQSRVVHRLENIIILTPHMSAPSAGGLSK